ncbi:MAG: acetyltransferase [Methylobacter sp.]|nr:MAG: acetyltransferase [Methylobacter sp.]
MTIFNLQLEAQHCELLAERGLNAAVGVCLRGSFYFEPPARIWQRVTLTDCKIGAFSYISPNVTLHKTEIGRYCSIGDAVSVLSNHPSTWLTTSPIVYEPLFSQPFRRTKYPTTESFDKLLPVKIGNDVWIGSGVKIKGGVTIGDGAIIGAGAVVTRDVGAFSIVGGIPAKLIRMRFGQALIARMQALNWYQYDISNMALAFESPEKALEEIARLADTDQLTRYSPQWVCLN